MTPAASTPDLAAWLGEGSERCRYCLQGYSLEVEVRCVECDEPGCPHCVVHVRARPGAFLCRSCAADARSSSDSSREAR